MIFSFDKTRGVLGADEQAPTANPADTQRRARARKSVDVFFELSELIESTEAAKRLVRGPPLIID
jgi:hypothetical protein